MLLTITTTHAPADELGFLLHKNPAAIHERDLPFGTARVCYPVVDEHGAPRRCRSTSIR